MDVGFHAAMHLQGVIIGNNPFFTLNHSSRLLLPVLGKIQ